jgi:hypothetical protein
VSTNGSISINSSSNSNNNNNTNEAHRGLHIRGSSQIPPEWLLAQQALRAQLAVGFDDPIVNESNGPLPIAHPTDPPIDDVLSGAVLTTTTTVLPPVVTSLLSTTTNDSSPRRPLGQSSSSITLPALPTATTNTTSTSFTSQNNTLSTSLSSTALPTPLTSSNVTLSTESPFALHSSHASHQSIPTFNPATSGVLDLEMKGYHHGPPSSNSSINNTNHFINPPSSGAVGGTPSTVRFDANAMFDGMSPLQLPPLSSLELARQKKLKQQWDLSQLRRGKMPKGGWPSPIRHASVDEQPNSSSHRSRQSSADTVRQRAMDIAASQQHQYQHPTSAHVTGTTSPGGGDRGNGSGNGSSSRPSSAGGGTSQRSTYSAGGTRIPAEEVKVQGETVDKSRRPLSRGASRSSLLMTTSSLPDHVASDHDLLRRSGRSSSVNERAPVQPIRPGTMTTLFDDMVMPYGPAPAPARRTPYGIFTPPRLRPLTVEHHPTLLQSAIQSGIRGVPPPLQHMQGLPAISGDYEPSQPEPSLVVRPLIAGPSTNNGGSLLMASSSAPALLSLSSSLPSPLPSSNGAATSTGTRGIRSATKRSVPKNKDLRKVFPWVVYQPQNLNDSLHKGYNHVY